MYVFFLYTHGMLWIETSQAFLCLRYYFCANISINHLGQGNQCVVKTHITVLFASVTLEHQNSLYFKPVSYLPLHINPEALEVRSWLRQAHETQRHPMRNTCYPRRQSVMYEGDLLPTQNSQLCYVSDDVCTDCIQRV